MLRTARVGLFAAATLIAGTAHAQSGGEEALVLIYGLASTAGTTTYGLTTMGIVMTVQGAAGGDQMAAATELYLRDNALQLAQDLARGDGPVVRELAASLGLDAAKTRVFGELLRKDRHELLELAHVERLSPQRAQAFASRVRALIASDERLRPHLHAL